MQTLHASYLNQMYRLLLTIFSFAFILNSCSSLEDGSNTVIKESINKRNEKKAILFLRESGATVADSYQVTVLSSAGIFDTSKVGNTFTVDDNHRQTALDSASINFTWRADDTLQIDYDKKLRTFTQENSVDGITVIYKAR